MSEEGEIMADLNPVVSAQSMNEHFDVSIFTIQNEQIKLTKHHQGLA